MKYKLRKYNINLEKIDLEDLNVIQGITSIVSVILMFTTFFTDSALHNFIVFLTCAAVLLMGIIDYRAQIVQRMPWPRFNPNNYFWVFNTLTWFVLFIHAL